MWSRLKAFWKRLNCDHVWLRVMLSKNRRGSVYVCQKCGKEIIRIYLGG